MHFTQNYLLFFSIICVSISLFSQENKTDTFGNGILNYTTIDSTFSLNASARVQTLSTTAWAIQKGDFNKAESNFSIRRMRIKMNGFAYSPKLKYKFELGLSQKDIGNPTEFTENAPRYILDAFINWNFYKNLELQFGQAKLPGNRERIISSANLQMADRSLLNSRFTIDRDLGIQIKNTSKMGEKSILKQTLSVAQGEGRNISTGNLGGYQYTAKLELFPFGEFIKNGAYSGGDLYREPKLKTALAVAYDYNQNAVKTRSNQGNYMQTTTGFYETDIKTLFVDAMLKYKGASLLLEYADRNAQNPIATEDNNTTLTGDIVEIGNSFNLQGGYLFKNNYEVSGRFTTVDYDKIVAKNNLKEYSLGVSKYLAKHKLKVQTDINYQLQNNQASQLMYRLQFELHL